MKKAETYDSAAGADPAIARFLELLRSAMEQDTFEKLVLSKYRGDKTDLQNVKVRPVTIQNEDKLCFVYSYATRDITKNVEPSAGVRMIADMLGKEFAAAVLFSSTEEAQILFSRKGKASFHSRPRAAHEPPPAEHDRKKRRMIDPARPFLKALGITGNGGQVLPSMSDKWKQINVFLEIFQQAFLSSPASKAKSVHVVDFGSGKGYLTFAAYDYLRGIPGIEAYVTGVELREDLVRFCSEAARKEGMMGLSFRRGDLASYEPEKIDIMIALHACDTATDLAIYRGIQSDASIIMVAPCCHKELRPQMKAPAVIKPVLRFGVHMGQEAEMVTDSLRALWMEAKGYETRIFEFISLEHTSKNKMILGVRRNSPVKNEAVIQQIRAIEDFYGITGQRLGVLLKMDQL